MADDQRQPNERVEAQARELVSVAVKVAFVRRMNALRKKGRAFTARAVKMWWRARSQLETRRAIAEAFANFDGIDLPVAKQIDLALMHLRWVITKERNPRPGTRPRARPLLEIASESALQTAKPSVGIGRPRHLGDQEERGWLARFYGIKLRLFMREESVLLPIDTAAAITKAKAIIKSCGGLDGDCGVSDRQVLCKMRSENPSVSLAALRSRLRRARERHQLSLFK